jgi:prepilin-type processing-associated H-X9-DG protein
MPMAVANGKKIREMIFKKQNTKNANGLGYRKTGLFADGHVESAIGKPAVSLTAGRMTWRVCRWG